MGVGELLPKLGHKITVGIQAQDCFSINLGETEELDSSFVCFLVFGFF